MKKRISDEKLTLFFELARGTRYVEFFYIVDSWEEMVWMSSLLIVMYIL